MLTLATRSWRQPTTMPESGAARACGVTASWRSRPLGWKTTSRPRFPNPRPLMVVLVSLFLAPALLTAVTLNWVKGRLIGKGSYGRVYLALNASTGDMMAVKQVEQAPSEDGTVDPRQRSMVDALQGEISLLKDLYHTNIVAYLGCETSLEYVSIFLEYVPGGTIAAIYRTPNQGRFEEQLVKFFTGQILDGLAYLHDKGIWHRDLKGDNILVDANGVCKISDFGISRQTEDVYDSYANGTMMKGSVFWMAPEIIQSQGERSYSGKVDIWSLGCVVLEMWTGARPWSDVQEQMQVILMVSTARGRADSSSTGARRQPSPATSTSRPRRSSSCTSAASRATPTSARPLSSSCSTSSSRTATRHGPFPTRGSARRSLGAARERAPRRRCAARAEARAWDRPKPPLTLVTHL